VRDGEGENSGTARESSEETIDSVHSKKDEGGAGIWWGCRRSGREGGTTGRVRERTSTGRKKTGRGATIGGEIRGGITGRHWARI